MIRCIPRGNGGSEPCSAADASAAEHGAAAGGGGSGCGGGGGSGIGSGSGSGSGSHGVTNDDDELRMDLGALARHL